MKFTQLKQDLKECVRGIYLLEGDDAYFRGKAEEQIKAVCLEMPELNFSAFDGTQFKGAALTEITSAVRAVPFMAAKRIVKVAEFYPSETDYEKYLKPVFEDFPDTSVLLIVNSQTKKGADLKRRKAVTYVDCNKVEREDIAKWAYLTMKHGGVSSSVEACEAIADYCLNDMSRVSREVEKLIEWGKKGTITKADVDEIVYKDADYRVYQMTGAVARRDYDTFTEIAADLLSKGFDQNAIIFSLLNYFKNLLTSITSELPQSEIAKQLKMTDYVLGKTRQQAKMMGKERLERFINSLYAISSSVKCGLITADGALQAAVSNVFFN